MKQIATILIIFTSIVSCETDDELFHQHQGQMASHASIENYQFSNHVSKDSLESNYDKGSVIQDTIPPKDVIYWKGE